MEESIGDAWRPSSVSLSGFRPPEIPVEPMEFLSRSWSVSALEVSKALVPPSLLLKTVSGDGAIHEDIAGEAEEAATVSGNPFSFASSATSQLVMERIMSQSVSGNRQNDTEQGEMETDNVVPGSLNLGAL